MKLKERKYLTKLIDKYQIKDSRKYLLSPNSFSDEGIICGIEILLSKKITLFNLTKKFEYEFAKYIGAKYALMVNSESSSNFFINIVIIFNNVYFFNKDSRITFNKVLNNSILAIFDLPVYLTSNIIGISTILKPILFI